MKSCCVTGHREMPADEIKFVEQELCGEIALAIEDGYQHFLSGFAQGADIIFARLVVEMKIKYSYITLQAALPYPNWISKRKPEDRALLEKCTCIGVHSQKYSPSCFYIRNRYMVDHCNRVIGVFDGREKGGTCNTLQYAHLLKRDIRIIKIDSGHVEKSLETQQLKLRNGII